MQADIDAKQLFYPALCPLCSTSLTHRETSLSSQSHQSVMVMCPGCGFSGPFVQRQPRPAEASPALAQRSAQPSQASTRSSVWIDPVVSAYLVGGQMGNATYPQGLSQQTRQAPRKPQPNPITPIPPRASAQSNQSAQQAGHVKVRPKYSRTHVQTLQDGDVTRMPTLPPPTMWEYDSPDFEVASSLPSLSLIVDAPTHPEVTSSPTPGPTPTVRLPRVEDIDTVPPKQVPKSNEVGIHEIDTISPIPAVRGVRSLVPASQASTRAVVPAPALPQTFLENRLEQLQQNRLQRKQTTGNGLNTPTYSSSWTAGGASESAYARRIAEPSDRQKHKRAVGFRPLDHLRWWLLHPGRIEFLLWLSGTILLMGVTFIFMLVTMVNFMRVIPPGLQYGTISSSSQAGSGNNPANAPTSVTAQGLTITLLNNAPLVAGQAIHVQGRGFSPHGTVTFTDEKKQPMLNLDGRSNLAQADVHGAFAATLNDTAWKPGHHLVIVRDAVSGRVVELPITLAAGLIGKKAKPTTPPTHHSGGTASSTATVSSGPGGFPTAVISTPVSAKTPTPTPTPTKTATPTPTPTPTKTVTPTPTAGITPTPTVEITPSPTKGASSGSAGSTPVPTASPSTDDATSTPAPTTSPSTGSMGSRLLTDNVGSTSLHGYGNFDGWLWLLIVGYGFAMLLLGLAGVLRKRPRS